MDLVPTLKYVMDYQKMAFNMGYNTVVILQGQMKKLGADMLDKSPLPKEILKSYESTLSEYKKSQDTLKAVIEDSLNKIETMIISERTESYEPITKTSKE